MAKAKSKTAVIAAEPMMDATLGPVGNVHIDGSTHAGQMLVSTGSNSGLRFVDPPNHDVTVIDWDQAKGDPTQYYGRLQGSAGWTKDGGQDETNRMVRLTWNYSNSTGTLSWWYPLSSNDHYTVSMVHRMTLGSVEGKIYSQGDGVTMYSASTVDGYWRDDPRGGMSVTCDEWGTGASKYIDGLGASPRSVLWLASKQVSSAAQVVSAQPTANWNVYNTDNSKDFWAWTQTDLTWNPSRYTLEVRQNGRLLFTRYCPDPLFTGGWVGAHAYCGSNMAYHDLRSFKLTIHNNPDAKPVGPYPRAGEEGHSDAVNPQGVVNREPGHQGSAPQGSEYRVEATEGTSPWWKFW